MNILLLSQVLPYPPDSGPKVKTWNLIKYLSRAHALTLVSFVRGESEREIAPLRRYCRAVHTVPLTRGVVRDAGFLLASLLSGRAFVLLRDQRAAMRRLVDRLAAAGPFDAVHADQLNMAPYALRVPAGLRVLDAHNALWVVTQRLAATLRPGPRRWLLEREWRRLRAYEAMCGRVFDRVLTVSEADRQAFAAASGAADAVSVIPIAVDVDELPPLVRAPDAGRIVHVGTMFWPPNGDGVRWFAEAIYPRIRAQRPGVQFDVVGARPPRAVRRLAVAGSGIRVTGYVDDPSPYLARAGVVVVPLRAGGGLRVKILTALAQALPVVTTRIGCEGLAVESGRHLLVADQPADFAAAVLRVLGDRALADALGRNGRRLVETTYDYRVAYRALDIVYGGDIAAARRAP